MAKVVIEDNAVDIRVSMLERLVLAERPRNIPLARIRSVDPHPPLLDMMVHWSDQSGSWLCGVSSYDGHMVPSARHPGSTLAIEMDGEGQERIYVELDDESPTSVAERIEHALLASDAGLTLIEPRRASTITPPPPSEATRAERHAALMEALDLEMEEEEVRRRDPLMQGSLPPGPLTRSEPAPEPTARGQERGDRDLSQLGSWLVGLGSLGLLSGGVMLASGEVPGLLAVGAGVTAALLGGVALAVVARHQD